MTEPCLTVEPPCTTATVDFLGDHGCTVKCSLKKNARTGQYEVCVVVTACDDRSTILGEIVAEVPEADQCF